MKQDSPNVIQHWLHNVLSVNPATCSQIMTQEKERIQDLKFVLY
jgi:hypothetical protein